MLPLSMGVSTIATARRPYSAGRPIRFAKGTGGHAPALEVAEQAARHGVRRLVFAHIGRPAIAALDAGHVPPFGEIGADGAVYTAGCGAGGSQ